MRQASPSPSSARSGASPAPAAGVVFAVGLTATGIGVGIAPAHLAKTGLTLMAIAGLRTLAGGLVALLGGGTELVRTARDWWRALIVPGLVFIGFIVVWSLGQAVASTNVPRTSVGSATPADVGLRSSSQPRTA